MCAYGDLVMSIDNFIWVPSGARYNRDGSDTKYKSGDLGSAGIYLGSKRRGFGRSLQFAEDICVVLTEIPHNPGIGEQFREITARENQV
jgi:hypothetical protein